MDVEPPGVERFEHHVVRLHHVAIAAVLDDQDRVLMLWRYRCVPDSFGWGQPHEIYVGQGAKLVGEPTDLEEAGHVAWVPLADIPGLMARGELMGSGTLVALLHVLASRSAGAAPTTAA